MTTSSVYPLEFKPNLAEAAERWEAFYAGEIIDRPLVCITAPLGPDRRVGDASRYHDRVFGDMDELLDRVLVDASRTYWGGEEIPAFNPSFGPDEIAVFCGSDSDFKWSKDSGDTNWSVPYIHDWEQALPITLKTDHPLWQRMLALYRRAAERLEGKMLISSLDLHTNMDLLAAARGPDRLCIDLVERPEVIDEAMESARAVFPQVWEACAEAGGMKERGYYHGMYSMEGAAILQCDFSCMIGPAMFARWVLPALEEEARIVRHAYYHWDGPTALTHTEALCASDGLHTMSYVPGDGRGSHIDYLDLLKRVQSLGKPVAFSGSPEECQVAHRELRPEKVQYGTWAGSPQEAENLLKWFVDNT